MNKNIIASTALLAASALLSAETLSVNALNNIYGAGHTQPPAPGGGSGGTLPPAFTFTPGAGKVLTLSSVTGTASLTSSLGLFEPDGNPAYPTNLSSYGGISGIKSDVSGFLVGVFISRANPADPAPSVLDFRASGVGTTFTTLSPLLNQMFYIGDGLTLRGSGSQQLFNIPATATALYLGFCDGFSYSGLPGQYQDNEGTLTVGFDVKGPLQITTQPQSQVGYWGKSVTFSFGVIYGNQPYTYQWLKDHVEIDGATSFQLELTNLQAENAGSYTVAVKDADNTTLISQAANLTVNPAGVSIATYAGLTIEGVIGQTYGIQATTDLGGAGSWTGVANVTLTQPTEIWYDSQSTAQQPKCFYRVVAGPISIP